MHSLCGVLGYILGLEIVNYNLTLGLKVTNRLVQ